MNPTDPRVGVVVARFQVPDLHEGHVELLRRVTEAHGRVVVVLGCSPVPCTAKNPLDYATRAKMVSDAFPGVLVVPHADHPSDEGWSKSLDRLLKTLFPTDTFALYSGRDGFKHAYSGEHYVHDFDTVVVREGTAERAIASSRPLITSEERRGAIYAIARRFGCVHSVVDVAVVTQKADDILVLVGRKAVENAAQGYRFIGGFVDLGESLERAAQRETYEESRLSLAQQDFSYVESFAIDDWRYRGTGESITSSLFCAVVDPSIAHQAKARDDMASLAWVRLDELVMLNLHAPLLEALKRHLSKSTVGNALFLMGQ